jgi:hypothetical protein
MRQQLLRDTVYIGAKFPPELPEIKLEQYKNQIEQVGKYLYDIGYTGVAGVDSIITEQDVIIPVIEINGRFTMSAYVSFLQNILGERKFLTRYFSIITDSRLDFTQITKILNRENIHYNASSKEGVIVYNSGTLPVRYDAESATYSGRLFALIVADEWAKVDQYGDRLETIVKELSKQA